LSQLYNTFDINSAGQARAKKQLFLKIISLAMLTPETDVLRCMCMLNFRC